MAAYSMSINFGSIVELCPTRLDRTKIIVTLFCPAVSGNGVVLTDDGDAEYFTFFPVAAGANRGKGQVLQQWHGPLVIEGEAARRRWLMTALVGNCLVGVLECFDKPHVAIPTEKQPLTEEGAEF